MSMKFRNLQGQLLTHVWMKKYRSYMPYIVSKYSNIFPIKICPMLSNRVVSRNGIVFQLVYMRHMLIMCSAYQNSVHFHQQTQFVSYFALGHANNLWTGQYIRRRCNAFMRTIKGELSYIFVHEGAKRIPGAASFS